MTYKEDGLVILGKDQHDRMVAALRAYEEEHRERIGGQRCTCTICEFVRQHTPINMAQTFCPIFRPINLDFGITVQECEEVTI